MVWQTLQRGTPDEVARTRFFVWQLGQVTIVPVLAIEISLRRRGPRRAQRWVQ
jgi:hypothetical protein